MLRLGIDHEKLYRATFIFQDGLCCCNMALICFRLFRKNLGNLRDFFGQMVYRPLAKNFQYAYALPRLTTFSNIGGKIKNREYVCLCRMTINACNNNNNNNNFISTQLYPTLIYMIQNNLIKIYREYRLPIITTEG